MKRKLTAILILTASALCAQTAGTVLFRAVMTPSGAGSASGVATIAVHVVEDSMGNVLSGSVDFSLTYQFPADATVIGLGIVNSPAGQSAPVTIATDISSASPVMATAGSGHIYRQAQVMPGDQAGVASLSGLLANTGQYSLSLVTQNPPATLSAALQPAHQAVLMAVLASGPGTGNATSLVTVLVNYTGLPYAITSGEVVMQLTYQFPSQMTFSSLRIYAGQGQAGAIAIPADLMPGTLSAASGTGVLTAPGTEIDINNLQMVLAVQGILTGPTGYSVDVDTVENPTSPLTGQLRGADSMTFPIPNLAGAPSTISLHTLRFADCSVRAGTVIFDVNYRLPAGTQITGVDIDGDIPAPAVTASASGFGNLYAAVGVYGGAGLSSLNQIVRTPENHHLNIHTSAAQSAMSAALAPADTTPPVVLAVIPIVEDRNLATFAPGELVEIYGTNLAKVTTSLAGWPGGSLPQILNGVQVAVGGKVGRMLYVSPTQIDAMVAFETPLGAQPLTADNGNGPSAPFSVNLVTNAPALYNFVFENANFSIVGPSNPAKAGDVVVLFATGFGQTMPGLMTGEVVPFGPPFFNTAPVTVSVGGQHVVPIYSIAAPPYVAGLYQIAFTVPAGLPAGSVPVFATAGGVASNTVNMTVH